MSDSTDVPERDRVPEPRSVPAGTERRPVRALRIPEPVRRNAPGADSNGGVLTVPRAVTLTGRIARCEKLVVEGAVETDLEGCRELVVARTGRFRGTIDVEIVDIAGTVEGSVTARGLLLVRPGGIVRGDVCCRELEVERGATLVCRIRPLSDDAPPGAERSPPP